MAIKPTIGSTQGIPGETGQILSAIKQTLDLLTGAVGGEIPPLRSDATLVQVVAKLNEVIQRLNKSGK